MLRDFTLYGYHRIPFPPALESAFSGQPITLYRSSSLIFTGKCPNFSYFRIL